MSSRQLRRDYDHLLDRMALPERLSVESLCDFVSARRGRPLRLLPMSLPAQGPCGLWVSTAAADYVVHESHTSATHRQHIVLHELAHVILEHTSTQVLTDDASRLLLPHLEPRTVDLLMGRTRYDAAEEKQAEVMASVLSRRLRPAPPAPPSGVVERLSRSLEHDR